MGSPMEPSHLTMSDLERSKSKSLRFLSLISCKGAELCHVLLLNINSKLYMGSPMEPSHLMLGELEKSKSRPFKLCSLISRKGAKIGYISLFSTIGYHIWGV